MSLPQLPAALRDAYLRRLGVTEVRRDLAGLTTLQAAHLRRVPFHNLALVVNDGRPYAIPTLIDTAAANARGVGGTCHLTNPPFAALLHTLGFDVSLVAGAVGHPGDHMLALVHFDCGSYVVDVGNGHPYLRPFPLGRVMSWQAFGWPFCWRGDRLLRTFPDDQQREVYSVDTRPRTWESFHEAIRAHHEDPRFGPFFSSLRAVRMTSDVLLTVRDALLTRYGSLGPSTRPIRSADAAQRVLTECIHLPRELVEPAIAALERRRPKLFAGGSVTAPRILIAVATIGREEQLAALLESVERDRIASGLATHEIEALILDNVASDHTWAQALEQGFSVTRRPITDVSLDLERRLGLIPEEPPPVCIGAARHALVRAVADHLAKRSGEWIVWMLDDDLRLEQLIRDDEGLCVRATRPLLAELRRLWADQPELSIGVGGYSGDPPVPGFAT
ncbi:MAG: arylamine N-acetyltransferase, partial [Myxococcales bacterium]|nr:arylamine N-acetyltransferase [Myxococcales bacterium]